MISILELECDQNNGVVRVYWEATKTVNENTATVTGGFEFTPNPDSENFIEFNDLTESVVINWFTDRQNEHIAKALDIKLLEQTEPQIQTGVPW